MLALTIIIIIIIIITTYCILSSLILTYTKYQRWGFYQCSFLWSWEVMQFFPALVASLCQWFQRLFYAVLQLVTVSHLNTKKSWQFYHHSYLYKYTRLELSHTYGYLDLFVVKVEFLYSNLSKIHMYELQKYPQKMLFLKCYSAVYRGRCVG